MADAVKTAPAQTRDERISELLEQSGADVVSAIKGPSLADFAPLEEGEKIDPKVEADEANDRKVRIPRSRLKTLTSKVSELEARLAETQTYQERVAELEARINAGQKGNELPEWWKENYGDNEVSRKAYANQVKGMRDEMEREFDRRERERRAEETQRTEHIQAIEQSFDDQMDTLEEELGRELTDNQKGEIMDIIGEYSPMENGRYTGYMSVEKAHELWLKGQTTSPAKTEMARIAGSQSSGGTTQPQSTERPQWGDWRKRFGG